MMNNKEEFINYIENNTKAIIHKFFSNRSVWLKGRLRTIDIKTIEEKFNYVLCVIQIDKHNNYIQLDYEATK